MDVLVITDIPRMSMLFDQLVQEHTGLVVVSEINRGIEEIGGFDYLSGWACSRCGEDRIFLGLHHTGGSRGHRSAFAWEPVDGSCG